MRVIAEISKTASRLLGAIAFYTVIPLPPAWRPRFDGIAPFAPWLGVGLGLGLAGVDIALAELGMPVFTRSALVVGLALKLTGGLHLDGAMDMADGLAVTDPQRRLQVMSDSRTGAFGAMVAIAILGMKTIALADLEQGRAWVLPMVMGWGRWGQVVAIARYPYLKAEGKGAFHKTHSRPWPDMIWASMPLLLLHGCYGWWADNWPLGGATLLIGGTIGWLTGFWFNRRLGGHTGDTYGAVVEWTEAGLLVLATLLPLR